MKKPRSASSRRVVVYGAGGHGRVVAEIARVSKLNVLGILDDGGLPGTLGGFDWLRSKAAKGVMVVLGIGENAARQRVASKCLLARVPLLTVVHPSAVVSSAATLGEGTVVMAGAMINPGAQIGTGAIVNTGAVVEHDCVVGDFAHVSPSAAMGGGARLGGLSHLGLGALVLPGIAVGDDTVIGAGAVVARDVGGGVIAMGVPARVARPRGVRT